MHLSYSQTWQWVRTETQAFGNGTSVCTDIYGNAFFFGNIFGQTTIGSYSVNALQGTACLIKYDSNGNLMWVKTFPTHGGYSNAVASDNLGNVYVTGSYSLTRLPGIFT